MSVVSILAAIVGVGALTAGSGACLWLAFFAMASLRSVRLLPKPGRTTVEGVTTLDDAVAACRASGLSGLGLVERAQKVVARKMAYSRRNPWDTPERAFERGLGYCIQQAMALKLLYDRLGIESRPVQAFRNHFPAGPVHGVMEPPSISGHMWVRVRIGGAEHDVCPGHPENRPGVVHFRTISRVTGVARPLIPLMHVFCAAENVRRDWRNLFPREQR